MKNIAIYCRVSTEEQDADKQEDICREYCKRNEWGIYKVYKDIISGTSTSRPQFNQLLEDMRAYKFKTIVVTKIDRIGRSLQHILSLFDEFKNKKVNFIAVTQNIETMTSTGILQMQILGAFAEFERNMISERTKEGLRRAKNVGKRGKDKVPRKRRGKTSPVLNREKEEAKKFNNMKKFNRTCKRCRERFETIYHTGKICKNCRGVSKE